jgi:hypothetical protein
MALMGHAPIAPSYSPTIFLGAVAALHPLLVLTGAVGIPQL